MLRVSATMHFFITFFYSGIETQHQRSGKNVKKKTNLIFLSLIFMFMIKLRIFHRYYYYCSSFNCTFQLFGQVQCRRLNSIDHKPWPSNKSSGQSEKFISRVFHLFNQFIVFFLFIASLQFFIQKVAMTRWLEE